MGWWADPPTNRAGYWSVWTRRGGPRLMLVTAVGIAFVHVLAAMHGGISYAPHAVAVPLAVLLGPGGVWGLMLGTAIGATAVVGVGLGTVLAMIDVGICALIGRRLWLQLPYAIRYRTVHASVAVLPMAVLATLIGTGLSTVGLAIVGEGRVAARLPPVLGDRLLLAVILAPVLVGVGHRFGEEPVYTRGLPIQRWVGTAIGIGVVGIGWLVGATVLSLLRADVGAHAALREEIFRRVPVGVAGFLRFVTGPIGGYLQLTGAIATLAVIWYALWGPVRTPGLGRWLTSRRDVDP